MTPSGALTSLHSFTGPYGDGETPLGALASGGDGNFYGVTSGTSPNGNPAIPGTVFQISPAGIFKTLYTFSGGNDGGYPLAGLVRGADGPFYGTTSYGGTSGYHMNNGTVFSLTTNGTLTTLVSFGALTGGTAQNFDNGDVPHAELLQGADGNFYGTTEYGGTLSSEGTVFKITTSGILTSLYSFTGPDGEYPTGALVQGSDGNFYGTTRQGGPGYNGYGPSGNGTVFKINSQGALSTLYSFTGGSDGSAPVGGLIQGADGNFYGATVYGGLDNAGTIFQVAPSGALTTLLAFSGTNGSYPSTGLAQGNDGNLYGTTLEGGAASVTGGTVFSLTFVRPAVGSLQVTLSPGGAVTDGARWEVDGGAWQTNGSTVASLTVGSHAVGFSPVADWTTPPSQTVAVNSNQTTTATGLYAAQKIIFHQLYSFPSSGANGENPQTGLVQGTDGNFYGTTLQAGAANYGTVFQIAPNGTLTNLASFNGTDGRTPYNYANLIQLSNGNFYGTTAYGGQNGNGVVFKLTPPNALSPVHSFSAATDGANPHSGLAYGADGNLYGTTANGGAYFSQDPAGYGYGAIFRMTASGSVAPLLSFTGTNGANPWAGLTLGNDGNLYGTAVSGGVGFNGSAYTGWGTIFAVTTNGVLRALYAFTNGFDGAYPHAELALGTDGNFYGSAVNGGIGYGTIFKITPAGSFAVLVSFNQTNGSYPYCRLVQGTDGNFYGTTSGGGAYNDGTVFTMTPSGALTTLLAFNGANGETPLSGLLQGRDGNFYGVTDSGGSGGVGTVFSFSPPPVFQTVTQANNALTLTWSAVAGQTYQLQFKTSLTQPNWNALGYPLVATNGVVTLSAAIGPDAQRFYRVVQSP